MTFISCDNNDALSECCRFPNFEFFYTIPNLEQCSRTCSDWNKACPMNVYQTRGSLFHKLILFGFNYTSRQKFSTNFASFDCEMTGVQNEAFKDRLLDKPSNITEWKRKRIMISVTISSILATEPKFLWNSGRHQLLPPSGELLKLEYSKKTEIPFLDVETTLKINRAAYWKTQPLHYQRKKMRWIDNNLDDSESTRFVSTQFLQIQRQKDDLQEPLKRYCKILPVFGFNCAKKYLCITKSLSLPIVTNIQDSQPTVIKKANPFIFLEHIDNQLFVTVSYLSVSPSFDSFQKPHKTSEFKVFSKAIVQITLKTGKYKFLARRRLL